MDIQEFLLARIAEDESMAREEDEDFADTTLLPAYDSEHQANWNTARVLRECAAKRAIIGSHQSCTAMTAKEQEPGVKLVGAGMVQGLDLALKSHAAVYSDHPDYQQEWSL